MKLTLLLLAAFITSPCFAKEDRKVANSGEILSIETKSDIKLRKENDGYNGSARLCFDAKTDTQVDASICDGRQNRVCEVFAYNFEKEPNAVTVIKKGTVMQVNEQFGPDIGKDWSKKTAYMKVFSNLTGAKNVSNPNLIIDCTQTKSGLFGPSNFSKSEMADVVQSLLIVK